MTKEKPASATSAPVETQCTGRVVGLVATPTSFQFDLRGRKSQKLTVAVDPACGFLVATVLAAFHAGDKIHATLSGSTAATMQVVQLRLGAKLKTKKPKALAAEPTKEPAS